MLIGKALRGKSFALAIVCAAAWLSLHLMLSAITHANDSPQPRLPTVTLEMNGTLMEAEIAATSHQRFMGLSFRKSLGKNEGMLFVYQQEQPLTFTMRNTLIPLSIAFISSDLVINEIHHMNVGPDQLFPSKKPAQYALEVDQGWFAANNIKVGDQIVRRP